MASAPRGEPRLEVITTAALARHLAPPPGSLGGAWLGLALALVPLRLAGRRGRLWRERAALVPARLDPDGWLRFNDATPPTQLGAGLALPPGPVLVWRYGGAATGYRGHEAPRLEAVLPGERGAVERRLFCGVVASEAQSLAIVVILGAPLWGALAVAALFG